MTEDCQGFTLAVKERKHFIVVVLTGDMQKYTDEDIARKVQAGDLESFGILVERYEAKMRRYARKFLFHYEDTADLVQSDSLHGFIA